jgi:hypothetical protein
VVFTSPVLADEVAAHVATIRAGSLPVTPNADRVAGSSAAAQASAGKIFHADLSGLFASCDSVGEVVGVGSDVPAVFSAFRQSANHWSLLNNPAWTALGTGQAIGADGMVYVSVVFCRLLINETPVSPPVGQAAPPGKSLSVASTDPGHLRPTAQLDETLPAIGARRSAIRARLDGQAQSVLPDWYVGSCGTADRARILGGALSESGSCPLAF